MSSDEGWVITEAGRGAEYTGTRSSGTLPEVGASSRLPLASARNSSGRSSPSRPWVGSTVLVSSDGSSIRSVTVTAFDSPAASDTLDGDTSYSTPGTLVISSYDVSY